MLSFLIPSVVVINVIMLSVGILRVIILSITMLSVVVMLNFAMTSVVAPFRPTYVYGLHLQDPQNTFKTERGNKH
jgi:hypothetical protein